MAVVSSTRHVNACWSMQLQTDSSGVGGRVLFARNWSFSAGHWIDPCVVFDLAGPVGVAVELYSAARRLKSSDVVTLRSGCESCVRAAGGYVKSKRNATHDWPSELNVTIPYPSLVGKYENATPPLNTSDTGGAKSAVTSVHRRGGWKMQPYSDMYVATGISEKPEVMVFQLDDSSVSLPHHS